MSKNLIILSIIIILISIACNPQQEFNFQTQWDTTRVLQNPDKGWYHHLLDNGVETYAINNDSIFRS